MNGSSEITPIYQGMSTVFSKPASEYFCNSFLYRCQSSSFISVAAEQSFDSYIGIMKFLSLSHLINLLCCHSKTHVASLNTIEPL